jgi:hypothetical protein
MEEGVFIQDLGKGNPVISHAGTEEDCNIDPLILSLGVRWGCVFKATSRPPVPIVQETGWAQGPILTGAKKTQSLAPTGFRTPNRPARSKSLRRLHYPGSFRGLGQQYVTV